MAARIVGWHLAESRVICDEAGCSKPSVVIVAMSHPEHGYSDDYEFCNDHIPNGTRDMVGEVFAKIFPD